MSYHRPPSPARPGVLLAGWLTAAVLAAAVPLWTGAVHAGQAADKPDPRAPAPEVVTTDSPEYCAHLERRIEVLQGRATQPPLPEVERQSAEGARLCGEGNARTGILHLRRALVLLAHPDDTSAR